MAMVASKAARLKPEIRLAEAVSRFEASLPSHEKAEFRNQRAQSLKAAPEATDVMRLTGQIDRPLSGKARRCLGPRFTNFLQGVQQFAAIGDVIVGGSQNIIACGVWSLVRMSILAITKYSSYIESMSIIFMEIGRSSPRHQELALMYTRSKSLQSYINEYFIVAVEFCHEMLLFTQKSGFRQFTTSLSGNLIKKTQADMDDWGRRIKDEMLLLMAKRTEDEAAENSRFRSITSQFSKSTSHHNKLATKIRILKECSTYDHETTWKQIRKSGNTTTFTESSDYKTWKEQSQSCTLLYYGRLGCGKSVALSNMVDDLNLIVGQYRTSVAYFFVRQDLPESLKGRTIIGTLVRQLLIPLDDLTEATKTDTGFPNTGNMLSLLLRSYSKIHKIYLVLDGLDLCEKEEIELVVAFVKEMQEKMWVLTCVSLRQEADRQPDAVYRDFRMLQISSLPDNSSDITSFIDTELARCVEDGELKLGNAARILTIRDTLSRDSKGMFLWVALQIKVLCSMDTDRDIEAALEDLPSDLYQTYFRILQKEQVWRRRLHQGRILRLITAAKSPLTVDEMRDALSVTPGDTDWNKRDTINNIYSTLATCGCLVQVDEEESTIRFVHPSVKEFFLRPPPLESNFSSWGNNGGTLEDCHNTMADVIVTYLCYGVFDTRISKSRVPIIKVGETPTMVMKAAVGGSRAVQSLALKLLAHGKRPDFDLGRMIVQESTASQDQERDQFPFLDYAKNWCLHHLCAIKSNKPGGVLQDLVPNVLDYSSLSREAMKAAIPMAIEHDSLWLLESFARHSDFPFHENFQSECQGKSANYDAYSFALCTGRDKAYEIINRTTDGRPLYNNQPPCYGTVTGWRSSWLQKYLDDHPNELTHICRSGRNLVAVAIWRRRNDIVQMLLGNGFVDVNTGSRDHTPIREAITTKNLVALELVLKSRMVKLSFHEREVLITEAEAIGFEEGARMISNDDSGISTSTISFVSRPGSPVP